MANKYRLAGRYLVPPDRKFKLADRDPDDTDGYHKAHCEAALQKNIDRLFGLQALLAASNTHAVLIVLQAMDAGGKDGTIRHVMTGLNPQACRVTSFKVPTDEELRHDFLWRIHRAAPRRGEIGIFNRSHYEDVLAARVHKLVSKSVWSGRYALINDFEQMLSENHVVVLKFFLHISKEEQARRLAQRIEDPMKNWKISPADLAERGYWEDYMEAYQEALSKCSTKWAPWYCIPANKKWFRNLAVSEIIVETMAKLKMEYPRSQFDVTELARELKR